MRFSMAIAMVAAAVFVTSCSQKPKIECTSGSATETTVSLIKSQLNKEVSSSLSGSGTGGQILASKIRATIDQLEINLVDVRTSKQDPNSTKKFCVASLHISVPTAVLDDAEKARSSANLPNVTSLAANTGVDQNANAFSSNFEYAVQPTDAGDKVYSESEDWGKVSSFYGELIASSLLKAAVEQAALSAQQSAATMQIQEEAAKAQQKSADHEQALTENKLATQTINVLWKTIDPALFSAMLDDQRAWVKKKAADCAVEAASASIDSTEQDTARLKCDSRVTQERITLLKERSAVRRPLGDNSTG